ncbi:MAG: aspartate aminotransferase family protein [Gammaproteobacteria bacterium]
MTLRDDFDRLMLPLYAPPSPVFVRGAGAKVWDNQGRDYVDFGGGIAVLSLGHSAPQVAKAVARQAAKLTHTSNLFANDTAIRLACELTKHTFAERVFLCNSGAEANEAALKLARKRGVSINKKKHRILSFGGAFHGRIGMAMAATPNAKVRAGFGPLPGGFFSVPYNDLAEAKRRADDSLCAIIVEPTLGEGGVCPAAKGFLSGLRALADKHNALLILDEIQTGAGRTGHLYQYMSEGIVPDVLTTAKGLGGGFPMAAMLANKIAANALGIGDHGTTFGGNPLAAAAALAVLQTINRPAFLRGVRNKSAMLIKQLQKANKKHNCFAAIRARGLLTGCDVAAGWNAKTMTAQMLKAGAIVITAGENTLRFAPPLNITSAEIKQGFDRINTALSAMA